MSEHSGEAAAQGWDWLRNISTAAARSATSSLRTIAAIWTRVALGPTTRSRAIRFVVRCSASRLQDFPLPAGQPFGGPGRDGTAAARLPSAHAIQEPPDQCLARNRCLAGHHAVQLIGQPGEIHGLQQVADGTEARMAPKRSAALGRTRFSMTIRIPGSRAAISRCRGHPAAWHLHVEHADVRPVPQAGLDGPGRVGGLGTHLEPLISFDRTPHIGPGSAP